MGVWGGWKRRPLGFPGLSTPSSSRQLCYPPSAPEQRPAAAVKQEVPLTAQQGFWQRVEQLGRVRWYLPKNKPKAVLSVWFGGRVFIIIVVVFSL